MRIAIAITVIIVVLVILIHPYIDGPDGVLRHSSGHFPLGSLWFGLPYGFDAAVPVHFKASDSAAHSIGPDLFDLLCARLC